MSATRAVRRIAVPVAIEHRASGQCQRQLGQLPECKVRGGMLDRFLLLRMLAKLHLRARDQILRRIILEWIITIAETEASRQDQGYARTG
jgi:hypothetical protein